DVERNVFIERIRFPLVAEGIRAPILHTLAMEVEVHRLVTQTEEVLISLIFLRAENIVAAELCILLEVHGDSIFIEHQFIYIKKAYMKIFLAHATANSVGANGIELIGFSRVN